jgi:predicted anti-sigma-YlaC factor YlaD
LVAYHFGVVEDGTRERLEEHLLECRACLGSFLALKRDIELSAISEAVPSARARARLREAVAKDVERHAPRKASSWWETALSFGFAGAAVACAFLITAQIATSGGSRPRGAAIVEVGH